MNGFLWISRMSNARLRPHWKFVWVTLISLFYTYKIVCTGTKVCSVLTRLHGGVDAQDDDRRKERSGQCWQQLSPTSLQHRYKARSHKVRTAVES